MVGNHLTFKKSNRQRRCSLPLVGVYDKKYYHYPKGPYLKQFCFKVPTINLKKI